MIILKWFGKLIAIPTLFCTSVMWLVVKVLIMMYGMCYGLLGIGAVAAMILFLAYQEWANVIALIIVAVVAFIILFSGTFILVLLEEINAGLRKIIRA